MSLETLFIIHNYTVYRCMKSSVVLKTMLLTTEGNSEIGVHMRSNSVNLICLRRLFRSKAVANLIYLKTSFPVHVRNVLWGAIKYKYHAQYMLNE